MKKIFCFVIIIFFSLFLVCCKEEEKENNDINENREINIIKDGICNYDFLCAEKASSEVISALKVFVDKVNDKTGTSLRGYRDSFNSDEGRCEVLIGLTNRCESIDVYNELEDNSYNIEIKNNCLVIVGSSDLYLMLALYEFEDKVLNNESYVGNGYFKIDDNITKTLGKKFDESPKINEILKMGYTPIASIEEVCKCPIDGDLKVAQGACSDNNYFYFLLRDTIDTKARIYKYDLEGNFIAKSDEMYLGHGNDMTYDTKNNLIIVSHGVKEVGYYSVIDGETLEKQRYFVLEEGEGGSITYNEKRDYFATSKGGKTLTILDSDFKKVRYVDRELNDYTAQGAGSDDDYIYFPMSGTNNNILAVYTWNCLFITNIVVNTKAESESFFKCRDKYYLFFYIPSTGGVLYNVNFSIVYN